MSTENRHSYGPKIPTIPDKMPVRKWIKIFILLVVDFLRSRHRAQLVSVLPSVLEIPSSILGDFNVCSDISLICVAVALNTRKMEHWQRKGVRAHRRLQLITVIWTDYPATLNKETFTFKVAGIFLFGLI